jgi:predicted DNA-binding transcriptional regulator AlpA
VAADRAAIQQPLAVDADGLARLLGIGRTAVFDGLSAGRIPSGFRIGRCRRWSVKEVEEWLAAGAPSAARWEAIKRN